MSSFQICSASSAGLPWGESPPVSAMPKPILMGSAARATNAPAPASTTAPATSEMTIQTRTCGLLGSFIDPSLSVAHAPFGARRSLGAPRLRPGPRACQGGGRHRRRSSIVPGRRSPMARLPDPLDTLSPAAKQVYDKISAKRGAARGPFASLMHHPALAEKVGDLGEYLRFG